MSPSRHPVTGNTHGLVGRSPHIADTRRLIEKAARHSLPVLLLGESGTGKEVVARAIHAASPRGHFVPIDCGSLVGTLMESELFGHAKGAFSGATETKKGLVEVADGGTAFFDEIGDLPLEMQVKLLRLVQEREFRAVGALSWRKVDLRIIAATHRDLKSAAARGAFRQDLYYRLNVFTIRLAPLRERKEDIPLLVDHFLAAARAAGLPRFDPPPDIMQRLMAYDWPGNVRELKHAIDRMAAMYSEGAIEAALPSSLRYYEASSNLQQLSQAVDGELPVETHAAPSPVISIPESEKSAIENALAAAGGERGKAAGLLRIGRTTLYRKMKQYDISFEPRATSYETKPGSMRTPDLSRSS
jgi:DNA-binding NtrC family response regulator